MPTPPATALDTRRERIMQYLVDQGYEGLVIGRPRNVAWFLGGRATAVDHTAERGPVLLKVTSRYTRLITTIIEAPRIRAEVVGDLPIEVVEVPWHDASAIAAAIRQDQRRLRLIGDVSIPGGGVAQATRPFWTLQVPLLTEDVERYRALGRDAGAAVAETCRVLEPGWTEARVAGDVAGRLRARGITPVVLLVGADGRLARYRHPLPTAGAIETCCMIVVCGERGGLVANLTRMVHFGALPDDLAGKHETVANIEATLVGASRPGAVLGEILQCGIDAYAAAGYAGAWEEHHQGGTTGFNARDVIATPESTEALVAGQAVAWNPSLPGVKSEDTFLVTDSGPELLTVSPDWPTIQAGAAGSRIARPAVLVR